MKRQSPHLALKVAQLRCEAAVTITITGKAGSGKSTAAAIIMEALALNGMKAMCIEANDDIHSVNTRNRTDKDDRLYLTIVEDSKVAYTQEKPEATEKECGSDSDCEDCDGKDIPPMIKAILAHVLTRASRQGM